MEGVNESTEDSLYTPNSASGAVREQFTQVATNDFMNNLINDVKKSAEEGQSGGLGAGLQDMLKAPTEGQPEAA